MAAKETRAKEKESENVLCNLRRCEESEHYLLYHLLYCPDSNTTVKILSSLVAEEFSSPQLQAIFSACVQSELQHNTTEWTAVKDVLQSSGRWELCKDVFEQLRIPRVTGIYNLEYHIQSVKESCLARQIQTILLNAVRSLGSGSRVASVMSSLESALSEVKKRWSVVSGEFLTLEDVLKKSMSVTLDGILTGFPVIDEMLGGGLQPEYYVIAGRPSEGKSAFVHAVADNIAMSGIPVLICSVEMTVRQVAERYLAKFLDRPISEIRFCPLNDSEIEDRIQKIDLEIPLYYVFAERSFLSLRERIQKAVENLGVRVVVVDYFQLLQWCSPFEGRRYFDSRERELSEISSGLKDLVHRYQIPVLVVSQLNREIEKRQNKRPLLSDLRDTGSLEQDADVVMFLYRDPTDVVDHDSNIITTTLSMEKGRNIGRKTVKLRWIPRLFKFVDAVSLVD